MSDAKYQVHSTVHTIGPLGDLPNMQSVALHYALYGELKLEYPYNKLNDPSPAYPWLNFPRLANHNA